MNVSTWICCHFPHKFSFFWDCKVLTELHCTLHLLVTVCVPWNLVSLERQQAWSFCACLAWGNGSAVSTSATVRNRWQYPNFFFFFFSALSFVVVLVLVQLYQGCRVFDTPQTTLKDAKAVWQHNQVRNVESYRPTYSRRYWHYNWLLEPTFPCVLSELGFGQPVVIACLRLTPAGVWHL